jgi:large subunit ribosomal protein L9
MKVVFLESVEGTAQAGEIKDVRNGFARNYLLPRKLAAPAVEPYLQRAQARAVREEKRQVELDRDATALAARLEGSRISIPARVGEQGKLYGSVTSVHIAEEVGKLVSEEDFDHRKVLLPESIKEIGVQTLRLRLTRNVEASVEVEVYPEGDEPGSGEAFAAQQAANAEAETEAAAPDEQPVASEEQSEPEEEPAEAAAAAESEPEPYEDIEQENDNA